MAGEQTIEGQALQGLKVLLADEDEGALKVTASLVRRIGHVPCEIAVDVEQAAQAIVEEDPDLSIVVIDADELHALELIEEIHEFARGPVIALLRDEDGEFVAEAARRGIDAYAGQHTAESVQSAIEVAMRRWRDRSVLREQVERLEGALDRRAVIERAKGILMERHSVDDRAAFALLRDHARSRNRTVVAVAESVLEGHALLPKASAASTPDD